MKTNLYQIALISLGAVSVAFFGVFVSREIFPEYKIYQENYQALEKFRESYTGEPVPPFSAGIKQIVLEQPDNAPPIIDRCTSCHVALQIPYFSPTKISLDSNGKPLLDANNKPILVNNEDYIWAKLDQKIAELTDPKILDLLNQEGKNSEVRQRTQQAEQLAQLKSVEVGDLHYDVTKVLKMHPLMGKETRPFEFHPVEEYGCTICHGGNGRGLTSETAHGPVFDGQYAVDPLKKPQFLEPDLKNDPIFAREFNDKPGDELIFQTTPILPGVLLQAKCVQCHQSNSQDVGKAMRPLSTNGEAVKNTEDVVLLTNHYHKGEQLFVSQACFACHRINGFSRGRVGPELSQIGNSPPWYIKEHIYWPQGGLPTSTMPNFRLDHEELQDLVTFLIGQEGGNRGNEDIRYKSAMREWEEGQNQLPWEKPITPTQIHDLRYSMTVFATEGCASCHRLKGFESNIGFKIEKEEPKPEFKSLYAEHQWFQRLFPETISGSNLVTAIDQHREEIDWHIIENVRSNSILEEIDRLQPDTIESFYTPFKYAKRAKNEEYANRIAKESDPTKQEELKKEHQKYLQQVHNVLMMFVQEYGLGRLICPKPNWSGIYRSDEWLLEHFHNPTSHVPRSIMPAFPFDKTKFYALTHMLDVLAIRNRNEVRAIWDNFGFDPAQAAQFHCAQCHGELLNGDGPISEWIYPIPKNLRNADFLRNLTKERVIQSIAHGVQGTPMPPWGEVAMDKSMANSIPVLKKK